MFSASDLLAFSNLSLATDRSERRCRSVTVDSQPSTNALSALYSSEETWFSRAVLASFSLSAFLRPSSTALTNTNNSSFFLILPSRSLTSDSRPFFSSFRLLTVSSGRVWSDSVSYSVCFPSRSTFALSRNLFMAVPYFVKDSVLVSCSRIASRSFLSPVRNAANCPCASMAIRPNCSKVSPTAFSMVLATLSLVQSPPPTLTSHFGLRCLSGRFPVDLSVLPSIMPSVSFARYSTPSFPMNTTSL